MEGVPVTSYSRNGEMRVEKGSMSTVLDEYRYAVPSVVRKKTDRKAHYGRKTVFNEK